MIKMPSATVETICFQDEIPVNLNTSLELETYIKSSSYLQGSMDSRGGRKAQRTDGTRQSC